MRRIPEVSDSSMAGSAGHTRSEPFDPLICTRDTVYDDRISVLGSYAPAREGNR